ncbi:MAG: adenylate/guanylate cyclase domain-containing protein [Stappiaceae bacterium]
MQRVRRRLAAILCADVAGYSRLMESDETGTLRRLKDCRGALVVLLETFGGRLVNTWGDSAIAEFPSVVDAVQCAIEFQQEVFHRNCQLPPESQMLFRIGVNLGDIMVEGDDIYGDGVNIAARMQETAGPGEIAISAGVHEQIRNKLVAGFEYIGSQKVKNISEPIRCFRIRIGGENTYSEDNAEHVTQESNAQTEEQTESVGDTSDNSRGNQDFPKFRRSATRAWSWFQRQAHGVKVSISFIGLFFFINLLSGLSVIWFFWPSFPFLAYILIKKRKHRKENDDEISR